MLENITMIPLETREFMSEEDFKATRIMVKRAIEKCFTMRVEHLKKLGVNMSSEEKEYWDALSNP